MPPKRTRAAEENPLEEERPSATPATPERELTLTEVLETLSAQNKEMRDLIHTLHQRIETLEDERTSSSSPSPSRSNSRASSIASESPVKKRDPKVEPPDVFTGKVSEFRNFIAQCTLTLTLCPNTYPDDEDRVLFVISRLRGTPLTWAHEIIFDKKHPLRNDYSAFQEALSNVYADRAYKMECEDKIQHLKQTGSAASYAQTFQILAAPLGLNKQSKCLMFFGGLHDEVKKAIMIAGRDTEFQELVNQAIYFDQMFYQQRKRESRESQDDPSYPNKKRQTYRTSDRTPVHATPSSTPLTGTTQFRAPDTTSHFRPPLTEDEKTRRRKYNLCRYCGDPEHAVENCPQAEKKNNPNKPSVSNVNYSKPHSSLLYPVPIRPSSAPLRPSSAPPRSENWQSQPPRM
jgi:hypothetical protein